MVSRFDHSRLLPWIAAAALIGLHASASPGASPSSSTGKPASGADHPASAATRAASPANDFPTYARVQYVEECMVRNGGKEADLYKCSCAIDRIAGRLTYDQFVEASTYEHYATLGGENGGIFRDHPLAQQQARMMRTVEGAAWRACGLPPPGH